MNEEVKENRENRNKQDLNQNQKDFGIEDLFTSDNSNNVLFKADQKISSPQRNKQNQIRAMLQRNQNVNLSLNRQQGNTQNNINTFNNKSTENHNNIVVVDNSIKDNSRQNSRQNSQDLYNTNMINTNNTNKNNYNTNNNTMNPSLSSQQHIEEGREKCCICWDYSENLYESSHCHHKACYKCWENWLKNKLECPMCRERVRLKFLRPA